LFNLSERTSGERLSKASFGYFLDGQSKTPQSKEKISYNDGFVQAGETVDNTQKHSFTKLE